jgi:TolB protein
MNADGWRRLLEAPSLAEGSPTWSPNGSTIAFAASESNADGTLRPSAVHSLPAAGGAPTRLTDEDGSRNPAWSPDGSRIAFDSPRDDPKARSS